MSSIDQVEMIWNKVLEGLNNNQSISDKDMMNGFMAALTPRILSEKVMILSIGDEWTKDYIESNYRSFINEELNKVTGRNCETTIVLSENQTQGKRQTEPQEEDKQEQIESTDIGVEKKTSINNDLNTGVVSESFTKQGDEHQRSQSDNATQEIVFHNSNSQIDTKQDNVPRNRTQGFRKTFDTFVVADTNKLAYGAAYSVAENPGLINNPLFIYGRSGLGKTHLLLAIKDYMDNNCPEKTVCYSPATNLINDYVNSLTTGDWRDFTLNYRNVDMLLLDDVQSLENAEETTNEFFRIFNDMISKRKQIVLSSDRAPKDINLDERLVSRFSNGVIADIQAPQFETKFRIFQNYLEDLKLMRGNQNIEIPQKVINRVIELSNSNIRNLEGAANNLVAYMTMGKDNQSGDPITVEEAEEIVSKSFFTKFEEKITISDIQGAVESYYKVSHAELLSKQRPRKISQARQVGMYLSRVLTQASYPEIGRAFDKDHSSVVHAYKNIEKKRQTSKSFFDEIERITDMIKAKLEND